MSNEKGAVKLAVNQVLTASYVVTSTVGSSLVKGESTAALDVLYTTGASETATTLYLQIETSINEIDWVPETVSTVASGESIETPLPHKLAGGAGSTSYSMQVVVPMSYMYMRVKVKESGVSSNFGTVSVNLTTASGSGMIHNTTVIALTPSGTQDVNLTKVGGSSVTLGQKTMAASIPVVLPSDQPFATSTKQSDGSQKTQLVDGSGNVIGSTSNALDINIKSGNPTSINITTGKTIKTVTGTVSADTDIVAAVPTKRIKVFAFSLVSASTTANTITFQSDASTALWTTPLQSISATMTGSNLATAVPSFLFATVAGEKLTLDVSAAQSVTYNVSYWDDDTT